MAELSLGNLLVRMNKAKLAGRKVAYPLSEAVESYAYEFRSNEQAADLAVEVVREWIEHRRPRMLKVDWDESELIERMADVLRETEAEWRKEPDTREEYGDRWSHAAERAIEELRRMEQ